MNSFTDKVKSTIEKYNMLRSGDTAVIGVSGGADSLCLLHVLNALKKELDIKLFAVHLNHQFRGIDAENDARFVEQMCDEWGIPHRIETFDVPAYAKKQGLSSEEAGREIRYKLFKEVKEEIKADKIAVAHNMNDNAETILMRLARGTGLEGLKGIDPVRDAIIRPLLEQDRPSIEAYCSQNGLIPRVDKTNFQPIYLRNKIRLELLPYMQKNINPSINEALIRLSQVVSEENDYMEQQTDERLKSIAQIKEGCIIINSAMLMQLHPAIQKRLVRRAVENITGTLTGFEYKHFQGILALQGQGTGAAIELPKDLKAYISYENLIICKKIENHDKKCYYKLKYNNEIFVNELNSAVSVRLFDRDELSVIPKSSKTIYIDADKVKAELAIRHREAGDRFSPIGMAGSKKLKDYFIDKKIPKELRDDIMLLADGQEIVWILGSIISEKYKVTPNTQKVMLVSCNNCGFLHNNSTREDTTCKMI